MIPHIFVQTISLMFINTSLKYDRITDAQSRILTKVHDLLGKLSYLDLYYITEHKILPPILSSISTETGALVSELLAEQIYVSTSHFCIRDIRSCFPHPNWLALCCRFP